MSGEATAARREIRLYKLGTIRVLPGVIDFVAILQHYSLDPIHHNYLSPVVSEIFGYFTRDHVFEIIRQNKDCSGNIVSRSLAFN
jgi:hypothetical protein